MSLYPDFDPFNRGKLKESEYNLKLAKAETEEYRVMMEERTKEQDKLVAFLLRQINASYDINRDLHRQLDQMDAVLHKNEEARLQLVHKNGELSQAILRHRETEEQLRTEIDEQCQVHEDLLLQLKEMGVVLPKAEVSA